ncbi:uncharacterized protein SPSK_02736 [Sporothrix schenckii 1099-18]|uniref:Uncharacterized protein n=1 Tax=Sporothrix schenckii 1099-18 TaxID=1397361 RepID=A0A0F2M9T3_SPOSC|nr:uncharacterized protein SPSK_02736 [Sporothrix schenckii 1099-18]KJR86438.1 hypothetical protein SPSK_02736 [Sporothrix schenckii 1099-18]
MCQAVPDSRDNLREVEFKQNDDDGQQAERDEKGPRTCGGGTWRLAPKNVLVLLDATDWADWADWGAGIASFGVFWWGEYVVMAAWRLLACNCPPVGDPPDVSGVAVVVVPAHCDEMWSISGARIGAERPGVRTHRVSCTARRREAQNASPRYYKSEDGKEMSPEHDRVTWIYGKSVGFKACETKGLRRNKVLFPVLLNHVVPASVERGAPRQNCAFVGK